MGHSVICKNETTYYNQTTQTCEFCKRPGLGRGTTPNCGYDDVGGRHEPISERCASNTFNDGAHYHCQPCTVCAQGFAAAVPCSAEADTKCQEPSTVLQPQTPTVSTATIRSIQTIQTIQTTQTIQPEKVNNQAVLWVVPLTFLICGVLLALAGWLINQKKGYRKSSHQRAQSNSISATEDTNELKDILSPDILAAPLKCALDDMDVLDELIMLLDPETKGIKNTKHLASLCNFSSTWVTYIYSLKDSKSPLSALLEGVICMHPEWTVGHLALLFQQIGREDAVLALGRLTTDRSQITDV